MDVNDSNSLVTTLDFEQYKLLRAKGVITKGMIPKLDNAFCALEKGVRKVIIGQAEQLAHLAEGEDGTNIVLED